MGYSETLVNLVRKAQTHPTTQPIAKDPQKIDKKLPTALKTAMPEFDMQEEGGLKFQKAGKLTPDDSNNPSN